MKSDLLSTRSSEELENMYKRSSNMKLLANAITPLCRGVEISPEAPVLGKALDVVLALISVIPEAEISEVLSTVLPTVSKRLKQSAPQVSSTCDQW